MPQISPWHSVKPGADPVYHDNSECNTGNNIESEYRRDGTDNRRRCKECDRLATEKK